MAVITACQQQADIVVGYRKKHLCLLPRIWSRTCSSRAACPHTGTVSCLLVFPEDCTGGSGWLCAKPSKVSASAVAGQQSGLMLQRDVGGVRDFCCAAMRWALVHLPSGLAVSFTFLHLQNGAVQHCKLCLSLLWFLIPLWLSDPSSSQNTQSCLDPALTDVSVPPRDLKVRISGTDSQVWVCLVLADSCLGAARGSLHPVISAVFVLQLMIISFWLTYCSLQVGCNNSQNEVGFVKINLQVLMVRQFLSCMLYWKTAVIILRSSFLPSIFTTIAVGLIHLRARERESMCRILNTQLLFPILFLAMTFQRAHSLPPLNHRHNH